VLGANVVEFMRVADVMIEQGPVQASSAWVEDDFCRTIRRLIETRYTLAG